MNSVERLKEVLRERNISAHRLEKDCGFSNGYIGQLKKGTIPGDRLAVIADYLGLTVNYLITGEDSGSTLPDFDPDHVMLIKLYAKLTEAEKKSVLTIMRSMAGER